MEETGELAKAFKYFQDASRNRDAEPEIFEGARIRYYALKNGDAWLEQEKKRLMTEKLEPVLQEYRNQFESLETEKNTQKAFTDSIAGIRDKQSSLKNSLEGNFRYLQNLLETKQKDVSNYNRYVELTTPGYTEYSQEVKATSQNPIIAYFAKFPGTFTIVLDVFIGFLIVFAVLLLIRKTRPAIDSILQRVSSQPSIIQSPILTPRTAVITRRV